MVQMETIQLRLDKAGREVRVIWAQEEKMKIRIIEKLNPKVIWNTKIRMLSSTIPKC